MKPLHRKGNPVGTRPETMLHRDADLDPTGQRWWSHMLAGDFEAAWRINDARRAASVPDQHRMWDGSSLSGRHVILRCLHGLGDAIQLLRYAPLLRAQAASLTVEVPPSLLDLASCVSGVGRAITWGERAPYPTPAWDLQIEINELPYLFRTTLESIPSPSSPYIALSEASRIQARQHLTTARAPRVGLVWESGPWDPLRSIPLTCFEPLFALNASFVSLQIPSTEAANQALIGTHHIRSANEAGPGLIPLAAVIAELDLVITVDTFAAHLAGALGRPVWLLLQQQADWRWLTTRTDSPWYPTMRLFRQPSPAAVTSSWQPVITAVAAALAHRLTTREQA